MVTIRVHPPPNPGSPVGLGPWWAATAAAAAAAAAAAVARCCDIELTAVYNSMDPPTWHLHVPRRLSAPWLVLVLSKRHSIECRYHLVCPVVAAPDRLIVCSLRVNCCCVCYARGPSLTVKTRGLTEKLCVSYPVRLQ